MGAWPIFKVEVYGFEPGLYTAPTRDKARWRAFQAFLNYRSSETFHEFLARGVSVTRLTALPADDGYAYVRAHYGVDPRIGARYSLIHEGPNSGREVTCLYPGRHTSMVHCVYDGDDRAMLVHPMNIEQGARASMSLPAPQPQPEPTPAWIYQLAEALARQAARRQLKAESSPPPKG